VGVIIETHVLTPTTCLPRPTSSKSLGKDFGVGEQIMPCRTPLGKCSTKAPNFSATGSQFDALAQDGDRYRVGGMALFRDVHPAIRPPVWACHGATRPSRAIRVFMPDGGSARADFPGGDAGRAVWTASKRYCILARRYCGLFIVPTVYAQRRPTIIQWETTVGRREGE